MPLAIKGITSVNRPLAGVIFVTLSFGQEPVAGKCVIFAVISTTGVPPIIVLPQNKIVMQMLFDGVLTRLIDMQGQIIN